MIEILALTFSLQQQANPPSYTVRPGDTLSAIAATHRVRQGWPALCAANHLPDCNLIIPGEVLTLDPPAGLPARSRTGTASQGTGDGDRDADDGYRAAPSARTAAFTAPASTVTVSHGIYSYSALIALWEAAGGSPAHAATAACIAEHESGGNPNATGSVGEEGLWQINPVNGALATYNPLGNARSAVIMSHDGTNWGPWTTAPMCGV